MPSAWIAGRLQILLYLANRGNKDATVTNWPFSFETARRQGHKPHQFFLQLFTSTTARPQAAHYRKPLNGKSKPRRAKQKKLS
jgi:hypothetical protein